MRDGPTILHVDLDSFYASVEQLRNPRLRGRPVAVGKGVVLAASYEAKAFGVGSGMPGRRARQLCPGLVFVDGHFDEYLELSERVFALCHHFTPLVEQISIDEAFLEVAGSTHLFGPAATIASDLRRRVRTEVGLAISAGVARTKFLAKIGSQVAKPDGLVVVDPGQELAFLHPLPVGLMWGVGPVTAARLAEVGIFTIGELAAVPVSSLERLVGAGNARHLHALAWNHDPRGVAPGHRPGSVGAQSALGRTEPTDEAFVRVLLALADRLGGRLRRKDRSGRTISLRVRFSDMRSITRSHTLAAPVAATSAIFVVAHRLLAEALPQAAGRSVNLLGIRVSNLAEGASLQLELPIEGDDPERPGSETGRRRFDLDRSVDSLRERFGRKKVGFASVLLIGSGSLTPDGFRRLAEKDRLPDH